MASAKPSMPVLVVLTAAMHSIIDHRCATVFVQHDTLIRNILTSIGFNFGWLLRLLPYITIAGTPVLLGGI